MDYKDYIASRNLAWKTLIRYGVCELPVRTSVLCKKMGIVLAYGNHKNGGNGYCTIISGTMYIIIRKGLPITHTRFTVAHEMGHLLLGHVGECRSVNWEPSAKDNPLEQAANTFAAQLLAPSCVLWGCGVHTAKDIAALCNISLQSAQIKARHIASLEQKNEIFESPLERQLYKQFLPFIYSHRQDDLNCPENPL